MSYFTGHIPLDWHRHTLIVKYGSYPQRAARIYCSPERARPAEGGLEEILEITLVRGNRRRGLCDTYTENLAGCKYFFNAVEEALTNSR